VYAAVGVVAGLLINIACSRRQLCLFAVVLIPTYRDEDYDVI
jgi:hypothetical protein